MDSVKVHVQLVALRQIKLHLIENDLQESGRDFSQYFNESSSSFFTNNEITCSQSFDHD